MMNKDINIVVCFPSVPFEYGGAEIHKNELVKQLRARGFNVEEVILPHKWYPKTQILRDCAAWKMLDLTESNGKKIDLVIATKFPAYVINHPNKVVWLLHQFRQVYDLEGSEFEDFSSEEDLYIKSCIKKVDNLALSQARKIFTISSNVTNRLSKYNGIDSEVLYPPVSSDLFRAGECGNYILYTGRIDAMKRIEIMIEAMKYINTDISFKITGRYNNKYGEYLMGLVKKYGLEKRVDFLGFVDESSLVNLYANCFSVFYAPFDEDYGYSTVEAFMSKKPVITASDSGGPLEFVVDGKNGIIFDKSDLRGLASSIDNLYFDKNKIMDMGNSGYNTVASLSWDNVINKLIHA